MNLTDRLVERLASNDYESISPQALTLDNWMALAVLLKVGEFRRLHIGLETYTMVERIQSLLVDAAIGLSDTEFVLLLQQKLKDPTNTLKHNWRIEMSNQTDPIEKVEGRLVTPMEEKQPKTLHPVKLTSGEVTYE